MNSILESLNSPILLLLSIVFLPLVGFPAGALWMLAGSVIGVPGGALISIVGLLANITIAHRISHLAERLDLVRKHYAVIEQRISSSKISSIDVVLIVRTLPGIPLFVQNYFLGSLSIPFVHYLLFSLALQSCYAVSFVMVGASLRQSDWVTSAAVVFGVALLSMVLRRFARTKLAPFTT